MYPGLDKECQHDYYFHRLRKYRRPFRQWQKPQKQDDEALTAISEYYKYSKARAKEVLALLSYEQIDEIIKKTDKGGLKNDRLEHSNRGKTT